MLDPVLPFIDVDHHDCLWVLCDCH